MLVLTGSSSYFMIMHNSNLETQSCVKTYCSEEIYCTVSMVTSHWLKPYSKAKCCFRTIFAL